MLNPEMMKYFKSCAYTLFLSYDAPPSGNCRAIVLRSTSVLIP